MELQLYVISRLLFMLYLKIVGNISAPIIGFLFITFNKNYFTQAVEHYTVHALNLRLNQWKKACKVDNTLKKSSTLSWHFV